MTGIKESPDDGGGSGFHSHMPKLGMVALATPVLWSRTGLKVTLSYIKFGHGLSFLRRQVSNTQRARVARCTASLGRPQNCLVTTDHLAEFQISCFLLN